MTSGSYVASRDQRSTIALVMKPRLDVLYTWSNTYTREEVFPLPEGLEKDVQGLQKCCASWQQINCSLLHLRKMPRRIRIAYRRVHGLAGFMTGRLVEGKVLAQPHITEGTPIMRASHRNRVQALGTTGPSNTEFLLGGKCPHHGELTLSMRRVHKAKGYSLGIPVSRCTLESAKGRLR
jgi:hypothetical protein